MIVTDFIINFPLTITITSTISLTNITTIKFVFVPIIAIIIVESNHILIDH